MPLSPVNRFKEAFRVAKKGGTWQAALVTLVACCETVAALGRGGSDEDRAALRADLVVAWSEIVTPMNLPGVPDSFEPMVDALIENAISAGSIAAFDKIAELRAEVDSILKAA